jgi:hypothetical protein
MQYGFEPLEMSEGLGLSNPIKSHAVALTVIGAFSRIVITHHLMPSFQS